MKSKKSVYLMLVVVLGVWGAVIYKIFFQNKGGDQSFAGNTVPYAKEVNYAGLNDTFSIHSGYRDPFLGRPPAKKASVGVNANTKPQPVKPVVPSLVTKWPVISFRGLIRNQSSNKQIAMLQIDGQGYNLSPGTIQNGVELKRCWKDSVELVYNKEKRVIKK